MLASGMNTQNSNNVQEKHTKAGKASDYWPSKLERSWGKKKAPVE